jgi:para-aminobenzoate synthetase/4-amino-4-deoxychorismate lyase
VSYFLDPGPIETGVAVLRTVDEERGPGWLLFKNPIEIVSATSLDEVETLVGREEGERHAVGFLSFEAGPAFDASLPSRANGKLPLAWFAIYDAPPAFARELPPIYSPAPSICLEPEIAPRDYSAAFNRVHKAIGEGECYQVNLTTRLDVRLDETPFDLFRRACGVEPPPYAAFIQGPDWSIVSLSPELFLHREGSRIVTRPMKGTLEPGADGSLAADPKSRAENLMIVDMARNDLGRVAKTGSVRATRMFDVEPHRTVLQMTSTVEAESDCSNLELLRATFPPASVTGAPKVAACKLIAELEVSPREAYCGAIGLWGPGRRLKLSVGIRTLWSHDGGARYGIGSGIVWDSELEREWAEWQLKANVLRQPARQWELVECFHRDALFDERLFQPHLERVLSSAAQLAVPLSEAAIRKAIEPIRRPEGPPKIRVAIRRDGEISVQEQNSSVPARRIRAALAHSPIHTSDPNLRIKTNSRQVLDNHLAEHPGFDDVLLFDEQREALEFCRGNVVFERNGQKFTPDPAKGCLPGVGVRRLIESGEAQYGTLRIDEIRSCEAVYFVNSIRGIQPVDITTD